MVPNIFFFHQKVPFAPSLVHLNEKMKKKTFLPKFEKKTSAYSQGFFHHFFMGGDKVKIGVCHFVGTDPPTMQHILVSTSCV